MKIKNIVLFALLVINYNSTFSQGDIPCAASALTVGASCSYTAGTTVGSSYQTNANNGGVPTCASPGAGDVWYSFVAPAGGSVLITTTSGTITDGGMALYSGAACNTAKTQITCDDDGGPGLMPEINWSGLTPGTTYWVRFWEYSSGTGTFNICITTPPAPPSNDDCAGALPVTVNPDFSCTNTTAGTVASATASTQSSAACGGTEDDDVWFSFVATGTTHTIDLLNISGSTTDMYHSVWSGACPALSLVAGTCSDPNSQTVTGLTAGNTYYIRVYTWTSTTGQTSTFDVCVGTPPPPPANDNCGGAISLTVNPDASCGTTTTGTIASATASAQANTCGGTANDDVWYSFVATNTTHYIDLLSISGSTTDLYHSVYGGTCGTIGAPIICSDPNSSTVTGLTPGNTYYVRIYSWSSSTGATSTFNVCIGTPPPPPPNDNCGGSISLTMSTDGSCNSVSSTVASATNSGISACGGTANDDVWFSFIATNDSAYISRIAEFDSEVEVFDGCTGTSLGCQDAEGTFELLGLTVGNTYYIRVHSWSSTVPTPSNADFSICVFGPTPPPANVLCGSMEPICSDSPISFIASSGGVEAETVEPGNNYDCLSTSPNPTWYYMEIDTGGVIAIDITASSDVDFALWGPYANLAAANAACGSLPLPVDCSYSISATEQANAVAVAGDVFVLLVTNYADVTQGITLNSASSNTAVTNCDIVLPVDLLNFYGAAKDYGNELTWITKSEINNDYFAIESSIDSKQFKEIGRLKGAGNSNIELIYSFIDNNTPNKLLYYRLKQVDFDGKYKYSRIIAINSKKEVSVNIYPNPSKNDLFFNLSDDINDNFTIVYTNVLGSVQHEKIDIIKGTNTYKVKEFNNLSSGIYFIQIINGNNEVIKTQKIIKE